MLSDNTDTAILNLFFGTVPGTIDALERAVDAVLEVAQFLADTLRK